MNGQDKGWCLHQGEPFIKLVLKQLQQQCLGDKTTIIISANRNLSAYQQLGVEVVSDQRENYCGPLSGIESVMEKFQNHKVDRWIVYPVDSINVPINYLKQMLELNENQTGYILQDQQPHFAHLSIASIHQASLSDYLNSEQRSIKGWLRQINAIPIMNLGDETIANINKI